MGVCVCVTQDTKQSEGKDIMWLTKVKARPNCHCQNLVFFFSYISLNFCFLRVNKAGELSVCMSEHLLPLGSVLDVCSITLTSGNLTLLSRATCVINAVIQSETRKKSLSVSAPIKGTDNVVTTGTAITDDMCLKLPINRHDGHMRSIKTKTVNMLPPPKTKLSPSTRQYEICYQFRASRE